MPPEIAELSSLTNLVLSQNHFKTLPFEIVRLTSLRFLEIRGNPLDPPLKEIAQNGIYAIMSYLLGLHYGIGFENVYRHRITVQKELRTALHQYLIYFTDFVRHAKGKEIDFNVITTTDGIELQIKAPDSEQFQAIGKAFSEYVELIGQQIDSLNINLEADISETEKQLLLVELRSQVRNFQTAVEIKNVRIEYLQGEVNFLRQLLTSGITHPVPIQIDVTNKAEAKSFAESRVDFNVEIADLQESFRELAGTLSDTDPAIAVEVEPLSDALDEIDDDVQDKTQIDRPLLERVGRFLLSLTDPKSRYGKALERAENGIRLLKKAGRAYNNVAEWLGLPQIPKIFTS